LPDTAARYAQLAMHIQKIFGTQKQGSVVAYACLKDEAYVKDIAERIDGWSGRTIQKFVNRLRQQALAQGKLVMTTDIVDQVIAQIQKDEITTYVTMLKKVLLA